MTGIWARNGTLGAEGRRLQRRPARAAAFGLVAALLLAGPSIAEPTSQGAQKAEPKPAPQTPPAAAQWAQPFAPVIGSRWRIVTETTVSDASGPTPRQSRTTMRYDVAYTAREGAGYRVTRVLREVTSDGNIDSEKLSAAAFALFRDITVEGITDAAGKPLRVVNEAEVRPLASAVVERIAVPFADKPQTAAILRQAMSSMLQPKDGHVATVWLDPLPMLAEWQNTGLTPGVEQRTDSFLPSPFGGILRSERVQRLTQDARPERFSILATVTPDPTSFRNIMLSILRRVAADQPSAPAINERMVEEAFRQMKMDIRLNQKIDVEDGMVRRLRGELTVQGNAGGQKRKHTNTTVVTVTPAP